MRGREKEGGIEGACGCRTSLDPIQRILYYSGSVQGKFLCYCTTFISAILHFCVHRLGNERPWNKLNNVLLFQEKLNKCLCTIC